ncbi:MAG: glycoside hydrolase [Bacteroidales bacterium]|nr:glycoside hydrolase [Bacteroidales bacterium]MCF8391311.1 glycoside hydrolase [Bacteroidales bacterium]
MKNIIYVFLIILITSCKGQLPENEKTEKLKDVNHYIVYQSEGRFAGWPANNAAFMFDNNEILVGFTEGSYILDEGHNIGMPYTSWLANSSDGGKNWKCYDPENYVGDFGDIPTLKTLDKAIDFSNPEFAMRIVGIGYHGSNDPNAHFFYTKDAGSNWFGPFGFGDLLNTPEIKKYGLDELTPRTDYVIMDKNECLIFLSARKKGVFGTDRLFCVKTSDGGINFDFSGWVIKPYVEEEIEDSITVALYNDPHKNPLSTQCRAVMSQTLKLQNGKLISVMRRKFEIKGGSDKNWIDAYMSEDSGKNWQFQSQVAFTGPGNGNPPAMALCSDGRLCVIYGERKNGTIQALYSSDDGMNWTDPVIVMDGFWSEDMEYNDLGYPRLLQRSDGKLVAIYYYSTKKHLHHIRASIWEP